MKHTLPLRTALLLAPLLSLSLLPVAAFALDLNFTALPRVWTTYSTVVSIDEDFKDLRAHNVDALSVSGGPEQWAEYLRAARKYGIKLITRSGVPSVDNVPDGEHSVLIGGAYQGKAIDRFRFPFKAAPQEIEIDAPFYHRDMVYNTFGRYYDGVKDPHRAEVIVKIKDFDTRQHLKVIPATLSPAGAQRWKMRFDLTGVEGDLDNVILAVYWKTSRGRGYFRGSPTSFSAATHREVERQAEQMVRQWKEANGGTFPSDVVFAMRFGDESWHFTGHTRTSIDVSYPTFDFSESAIRAWRQKHPDMEYPRGVAWIDVFGRKAYAKWLSAYHASCSRLVATVTAAVKKAGATDLLVFRNITRGGAYATSNDRDGTGLELLVNQFDIVHLDPYPVHRDSYGDNIPVDMSYLAGLARRYKKPIVPWMQAHQYYPDGYFGLVHPTPEQVRKMMDEQRAHAPQAIMWLGYSSSGTFPKGRADSWEEAGKVHAEFIKNPPKAPTPSFAVVRPYTVRALRDEERTVPLDQFFTTTIIDYAVLKRALHYDAFEPVDTGALKPEQLKAYSKVVAEVGVIDRQNLAPILKSGVPAVLFIEGADQSNADLKALGAVKLRGRVAGKQMESVAVEAADLYDLAPGAKAIGTLGGGAFAWQYKNLTIVAARSKDRDFTFASWLWGAAPKSLP